MISSSPVKRWWLHIADSHFQKCSTARHVEIAQIARHNVKNRKKRHVKYVARRKWKCWKSSSAKEGRGESQINKKEKAHDRHSRGGIHVFVLVLPLSVAITSSFFLPLKPPFFFLSLSLRSSRTFNRELGFRFREVNFSRSPLRQCWWQ